MMLMEPQMNYDSELARLKAKKQAQTREKIEKEGILDEDDYGRIVPQEGVWRIRPNHADGSFYGFDAWAENFCSLMDVHQVYVDPDDALAGRWCYFMSKMRPNKWNPDYPYDHLRERIECYDIIHGIGDDAHFAPDYEMGLRLGWGGLLDKIAYYRTINCTEEQQHFYDLHERAIRSIQGWIRRHIDEARRLAAAEHDERRRRNLLAMAETNENIVEQPPRTLREACQWIVWFHLASRTYNRDGAGGQIDALLRPFYEQDLAAGRITDAEAVYYLACLLINDPVYWQLGGPDAEGKDQTSAISFLILDAACKVDSSLNITIRVHDGLDPKLLRYGVECLVKYRNGWPRFSGDKALVAGFMRNGFDERLARRRIAVGCNWMSLPGLEYTMNDLVKVNLAKVFEVAYREMKKDAGRTTERLWRLFASHLKLAVHTAAEGIRHHLKYQKYNEPELLLNLLSHGPMEKGCDVSDGGAQYYNLSIDGAGLAVVADSFAVLEQRIEQENRLDWATMDRLLETDFQCADGLKFQTLLSRSQRYGQADSLGRKWALAVRDEFTAAVRNETSADGRYKFIPGFFSWANTVGFGLHVGATPNGRRAGTPISHGANPCAGFAVDDASLSLATAIAEIQPGYGNTAPMQWELDPSLAGAESVALIEGIIKAHFEMGGTLINANIMDRNTILAAHADPSKYPDLVVRITGFTAYFAMLSPEFRQLVVDRVLEN
ncbi:MAG: pyruvate formate lyase family protein [Alistipes sp.]|nr:pyruvate formate lyase family protein [Alistipes sp.]